MNRRVRIHILGALSRGNIGTLAAQRALYKLLIDTGEFDLSISVGDKKLFKLYHPEFKGMELHEPLYANLRDNIITNHLRWIIFSLWNLPLFTFTAMLIPLGIKLPHRTAIINRMKKCDIFLDLNLELYRGIPISVSSALIKKKPRTLILHNIY